MYDYDLMGDTNAKKGDEQDLADIIAQHGEGFFDLVNSEEQRKFQAEWPERRAGRPVTWRPHRLFLFLILVEAYRHLHGPSAFNACRLLAKQRCLPIPDPRGDEVLYATPGAIVGRNTNREQLYGHYKEAKRLFGETPDLPGLNLASIQAYARTLADRCKKVGS